MSGQVRKYEYGYVPDNCDIWVRDETMEFGFVYARDLREARALAWDAIPYGYTVCMTREVFR